MHDLFGRWSRGVVAGNTILDWILAALALIGVALALRVIQALVVGRLARAIERTHTRTDDVLLGIARATSSWFHLSIGLLVAGSLLSLSPGVSLGVRIFCTAMIGIQFGRWAQKAVSEAVTTWAAQRDGPENVTMAAGLRFLARLVIWTIVVLVVLSNLGIELSAVVAGLGVGGVAAALAVQSTLGDLIAGVSMYFDRPFDLGDFIIVDDFMGNVQKIGVRTTRVASLGGEEIVFANGDLVKARIRNYARMRTRRIVFDFRIEYGLPAAKVERAREIVSQIVRGRDGLRFERAHFKAYGSYALEFEVVYHVLSPDYNAYMDHQHAINLALYQSFEAEGIRFAFPTQTIFTKEHERGA